MLKHIVAAVLLAAANCAAFAQEGPRPGAMFENADANHDGSIARDEFIAARAEAFAKLDQNSDGVIDDADRRNPPREGGRGERMMARVDANSDGKISKDEFVNGATPMFDRADTDGNGALDARELEAVRERARKMRDRRPEGHTQ